MIVTVTDKKTGEHYQTHIDVLRVVDEDTRIRIIPYGQGIHTIYYADMVTVKVTDNDNSLCKASKALLDAIRALDKARSHIVVASQ